MIVCENKQSDRSEPGGLHMNDDGTATLYPVGIAKYEKVTQANRIVLEHLLKVDLKESTYFEKSYIQTLVDILRG
jgi:hypothetical protein